MPIDPDTPRARETEDRKALVAELLAENQFRTNRSIADEAGSGWNLVKQVREEITGSDGLIVPSRARWRRQDLPKTPEEVEQAQERDIDELVLENQRLRDRLEALEAAR